MRSLVLEVVAENILRILEADSDMNARSIVVNALRDKSVKLKTVYGLEEMMNVLRLQRSEIEQELSTIEQEIQNQNPQGD